MKNDKKRRLPRHVDGRIMIGPIYVKNFFIKFLPIALVIFIIAIRKLTPVKLLFSSFAIFTVGMLNSEINRKETTIDMLKDIIKNAIEGEVTWERSCLNVPVSQRCIRNKIKGKKRDNL